MGREAAGSRREVEERKEVASAEDLEVSSNSGGEKEDGCAQCEGNWAQPSESRHLVRWYRARAQHVHEQLAVLEACQTVREKGARKAARKLHVKMWEAALAVLNRNM